MLAGHGQVSQFGQDEARDGLETGVGRRQRLEIEAMRMLTAGKTWDEVAAAIAEVPPEGRIARAPSHAREGGDL